MSDDRPKNPLIEKAVEACGGKQQYLADALGCAQQTVSKLLTGEIPMSADWALRIDRATSGVVSAVQLYPELAAMVRSPDTGSGQPEGGQTDAPLPALSGACT